MQSIETVVSQLSPVEMGAAEVLKLNLKTKDNVDLQISENAIKFIAVLNNAVEDMDGDTSEVIPVFNVDSPEMKWIIEFCEYHSAGTDADALSKWDKEFSGRVGIEGWIPLLKAVNYLNVELLLDLGITTLADAIKDKTPDEIREILHITNDFTPEEEEELRDELKWAIKE